MTGDAAQPTDSPGFRAPTVLLVTGMSGAGRSTALAALEDLGYEAIDNLPLSLLDHMMEVAGDNRWLAIGVDIRTLGFGAAPLMEEMRTLERRAGAELIFIDCDDEVLQLRYTETRRRHPLADDRPVMDGVRLERRKLAAVRDQADRVIDTSLLHARELKQLIKARYAPGRETVSALVTSFSFARGLPREADMVFDVRFLDNPHYRDELRPLTGLDAPVAAFIEDQAAYATFFERVRGLIVPLLPLYDREGKSYLTIAVGCTGGRHRSVFVAERLAARLSEDGHHVTVRHRDLENPIGRGS